MLRLDLGAGSCPREGFTGVDVVKLGSGIAFDLVSGDKWPWKDGAVEELASSHFIEHIPAHNVKVSRTTSHDGVSTSGVRVVDQDALFFFFDEAFRVIRPGGLFHLTWPALKSSDAFRDPTHRRFLPLEFLHYLSVEERAHMGLEHYEAHSNWIAVPGSAQIHLDPLRSQDADSAEVFGIAAYERHWDIARAISVTLRADKSSAPEVPG